MGEANKNVFEELDFADKSFSSASYSYYPEQHGSNTPIISGSPSTAVDYYEHFSNSTNEQTSTPDGTESPLSFDLNSSSEIPTPSAEKPSLHHSPLSNIKAFQRILNSSKDRRGSGVIKPTAPKPMPISPRIEATTRYVKQLPSTPVDVKVIRPSVEDMSKEDVIENLHKYEEEERKVEQVAEYLLQVESEIDQLSLGSSDAQVPEPVIDPSISGIDDLEPPSMSLDELTDSAPTSSMEAPLSFSEKTEMGTSTLPPRETNQQEDNFFANENDVPAHLAHLQNESNANKRHTMYINLFKKEPSLFETQHNLENVRKATMAVTPSRNNNNKSPNREVPKKLSKDVLATPRQILKVYLPYDQSQVLRVDHLSTVRDLLGKIIRNRLPNCTLENLTVSYMNKEPVGLETRLSQITADIFIAIKSKKAAELEAELDGTISDSLLKLQSLVSTQVKVLSNLKNIYMMELKADKYKVLSAKKFNTLFFGVEAIHQLNFTFLNKLSTKVGEANPTGLKTLFFLLEGCIPLYVAFAVNFPQAMLLLKKLQSKAKFAAVVDGIRMKLQSTETLSDLLSFTIQSIPKMQLVTEGLERQLIKLGDKSGDLEAVSAFLSKLPQIPLKSITMLEGGSVPSSKKTPRKNHHKPMPSVQTSSQYVEESPGTKRITDEMVDSGWEPMTTEEIEAKLRFAFQCIQDGTAEWEPF